MSNLSVRAAFGGAWSTHWAVWLGLFPISLVFIMYREQSLGPSSVWWGAASAVAQHLVAGLVIVVVGAVLRRRRSILPVGVVVTLWALACPARALVAVGITSVGFAEQSSPVIDTVIWLGVSLLWIPIAVYAVAQFDQRRLLIAARDITADSLIAERAEEAETAQQLHARLLATVTAQLSPVLADREESLNAARRRITSSTAAELGMRISRVHDETQELVDRDDDLVSPTTAPERGTRVTMRRAFEISSVPPARVAALVTLATLVGVLPDTVRVYGTVSALHVALAVVAAGILLAALPALFVERVTRGARITHLRVMLILQGIAVGTAFVILVVTPPGAWSVAHWPVIVLTLVALAHAHTMYSMAFIVTDANARDEAALSAATHELDALRAQRSDRSRSARQRMAHLMHGPIQGRLAACVMALNFHAEIVTTDPARAEAMLDAVLEHLHGVSDELQRLGLEAAADPGNYP